MGSCDPSAGFIEASGSLVSASLLLDCAAPSSTPVEPSRSSFCSGNASALLSPLSSLPLPLGDGSTCAAGFQCVPTEGGAQPCSTGQCVQCTFGQWCPAATSNRCGAKDFNLCPKGASCRLPSLYQSCQTGFYCPTGTYDGGVECPNLGFGRSELHDTTRYGYTLYCPNGSSAPDVCAAGWICRNASFREPCPAGYKCPRGVNATQRCLTDGFGSRSPESRCPEGSSAEGSKVDLVVVPIVLLALFWLGARAAGLLLGLRRRRRAATEADKEPKDGRMARFTEGQNLLAAVVSGALDAQRRHERSARAKRLHPFAKHFRQPSAGPGQLFQLDRAYTRSNSALAAGHHPPEHAKGGSAEGPSSPLEPNPRSAHRLKFAVHRALSRRRMQVGQGENFVALRLQDVTFTIGGSTILSRLNADMEQGQLCALMGESGSGKTTLLNAISGRASYGTLSGEIALNNQPMRPGTNMGFVPQAYLVQRALTVYENLWYSSVLRLPGVSNHDRHNIVISVLDLLGLAACAHFSCDREHSKKKLSGGQLRRVGIGAELVTRPAILLLDEPTSALDAVNTRLVVDVLKNLCEKHGILVIASLHQPRFSVVNALDKVMVLRKGEFIYAGAQREALGYFAPLGFVPQPGENPADFYIEVAFGLAKSTAEPSIAAEELAAKWNARVEADRAAELASRKTGPCTQVDFVGWCRDRMASVGSDTRLELWELVSGIAALAEVGVTWELVYANIESWEMSARPLPSMWSQFRCCLTRYTLALWRKRSKYITTLIIMYGLGLLCGIMSGPEPASNTRITLLMLSIASYSVVSATVTLISLGSDDIERACFEHESAQGVRQLAEGLARMLADTVFVLVPTAPMFVLPYAGMTATHINMWLLLWLFFNIGWSYTAFGYVAAMFAGKGSAIAATAGSFVCAILLTGVIGAAPADVVSNPGLGRPWLSGDHWSCSAGSGRACPSTDNNGGYGFFMISPGMWAILAGGMLDATSLQFGEARIFVLSRFQSFGLIPGVGQYADIEAYERGHVNWYSASIVAMLIFGLLVRLISLTWFIVRHWDKKAKLRRLLRRLREGTQQAKFVDKVTQGILVPQIHRRAKSGASTSPPSEAPGQAV